ncbi:NADH dehydrogenase [ubiquinone] 1 beta subcomplex subunit 1 isoform X3 [Taeniopygia guttata]
MGAPRDGTSRAATLKPRACPTRGTARAGRCAGAPALQRPTGPDARAWPLAGRGYGGEPCAHSSPRRGEQGEEEDDAKEPVPAALNHPQPAPRSPPSCGGAEEGPRAEGERAAPPRARRGERAPPPAPRSRGPARPARSRCPWRGRCGPAGG